MTEPERCDECGFDGSAWTDAAAGAAIAELPSRWRQAVDGVAAADLQRRPVPTMWSIAEYVDHVREVLFGMRFILDVAVGQPGTELGEAPEPRFDPEPRVIDVELALSGLGDEAARLHQQLGDLDSSSWASTVVIGADEVDVHWIARHAVHDPTHHLGDVSRLRDQLGAAS